MPKPLEPSPTIPRKISETRYGPLVHPVHDDPIGKSLETYGEWAEAELSLLSWFVGPGSTVLDIGSNVGTHVLAMSRRVGTSGRVLAFEPQRALASMLEETLAANGIENVVLRRSAVGARDGTVGIPRIDYGDHVNTGSVSTVDTATDDMDEVRLIAIDGLALQTCSLAKIDVEGMEADVLAGMSDTIARTRPVLFLECNDVESGVRIWQARPWRDEAYSAYLVRTTAFDPHNFVGATENFFGHAKETGLLLVPDGAPDPAIYSSPGVETIAVANLDELAAAILSTPRYGDAGDRDRDPVRLLADLTKSEQDLQSVDASARDLQASLGAARDELERERNARAAEAERAERMAFRCDVLERMVDEKMDFAPPAHPVAATGDVAARAEVEALRNSTSWRITAPMRSAATAWRRFVR